MKLTKDDYNWWSLFREVKKNYLENDEFKMISEIYARLWEVKTHYPCKCSPKVIQSYIDYINKAYDNN